MMTKEKLIRAIRALGIKKGDLISMHSALSPIGFVEGGADTLIDAFLEVIGEEGTLIMSTLTGGSRPFDPNHSPSAVGKISEIFRNRPNAIRSLHPTHSIAAVGKMAEYITAGHEADETPCGSPYEKIRELGGYVVLLGVDHNRSTIMHAIEEYLDVDYLVPQITVPAPTYSENGEPVIVKKYPPGHRSFITISPELRARGLAEYVYFGDALVTKVKATDLYALCEEMMKQDPYWLLCKNPSCNHCSFHRSGRKVGEREEDTACGVTNCECCDIRGRFDV